MPPKVLVADDSATIRQQVGSALSGAGYEVVEAVDGQDALERLETADFALVISDVNMPRLDGIAFLIAAKKNPRHAALPIVMLTGEGQADMIEQAKRAGAKAWIVKPFKTELLIAAVNKLVPR